MTVPALTARPWTVPELVRSRSAALDGLRGLAVVLMFLDHALIVTGHQYAGLRYTLTRAAMPLFFFVSGHLFRRLTLRHAAIALVGAALPVVVPWVDSPNVLLLYAMGCVSLWAIGKAGDRVRVPLLVFVVALPLVLSANGFDVGQVAGSYAGRPLWALMALGALVQRRHLDVFAPLGRVFGWAGRFPLTAYLASTVGLTAAVAVLGA